MMDDVWGRVLARAFHQLMRPLAGPYWVTGYGAGKKPHEGFTLTEAQLREWKR